MDKPDLRESGGPIPQDPARNDLSMSEEFKRGSSPGSHDRPEGQKARRARRDLGEEGGGRSDEMGRVLREMESGSSTAVVIHPLAEALVRVCDEMIGWADAMDAELNAL